MTDTPTRDRPQVDTAAAAVAPSTPASSSSSTRPNQHRSRSSFSGTSSDGLTSPKAHHYNPHPYGAITTSSGNLTRSNSVPSSMSWVSTHKPSRSLSSMDQQQPRPLPIPPSAASAQASRVPGPRAHRRSDSAPFVFPPAAPNGPPAVSESDLSTLPHEPAEWSHAQLLRWLEVRLAEEGLAKPVVHDVLTWLGTSRPSGAQGGRVGGLALDGKEFMKGKQGAWAKTGTRPPFHSLLFQLSHNLRNRRRHPRHASAVLEADEDEDDATPVKRLVRDWEERSNSSASEAGSDDDDDDGSEENNDDLLKSPSARRSRASEKRYRRRSSLKNAAEAAASSVRLASGSSSEGGSAALSTPPPPPYAFDVALVAPVENDCTLDGVEARSTLDEEFSVGKLAADELAPSFTPVVEALAVKVFSSAPAAAPADVESTSQNGSFLPPPPDDGPSAALLEPMTLTKRQRKSYDGLGSGFGYAGHDDDSGDDRQDRRVMTVKPRKSSGPPLSARVFPEPPSAPAAQANAGDVDRLKALVTALSDRMRTLETRLDSLETLAAAPPVRDAETEADDEKRSQAHPMGYRHLPGYIALVSLGVVIIAWGVFSRGRRGGRA